MRHTTDIRWFLEQLSNVRVHLNAQIVVPTGVTTLVNYDVVDFDNLGEWNAGTSQFIPTYAGWYEIAASVHVLGAGGGFQLQFEANDNAVITHGLRYENIPAGMQHGGFLSMCLWLDAAEVCQFEVFQASGANMTVYAWLAGTYCYINRVPVIA